ncbi:MAG: hypothetical protein ABJJ44_02815 [Paraglaciecola sp.]|uniref:hypothetical protein n=2 Tax=Paraglaciecola sp. TaxID=1920173 RepID=UPI003296ADD7
MDKIEFVAFCESQLKRVFNLTKQGKPDTKQKHRVEGVLLAGEMLGVIDRLESSELMEKAHLEVFGETLAARTERKQAHAKLKALSPDDYFDIPAIERRK